MDKEIKKLVNDVSKDLEATRVIRLTSKNGVKKKIRVPDHEKRLEALLKCFRLKGYDV